MTSDLYYILMGFKSSLPRDIFSNPNSVEELNKTYKELLLRFHPDRNSKSEEDEKYANEITVLLGKYRDELEAKLSSGVVGDYDIEVKLGKRVVRFTDCIWEGDLSVVLRNGKDVLKVLREPSDIDLFRTAERNIKVLKGKDNFDKYLLGKITPVEVKMGRVVHPAQHYEYVEGYTLNQIKEKHGDVPAPHSTWMLNRVLEILCWSHSKGISNMAVLPRHILIIPKTHGGVLLDWTCSTDGAPVIVASTEDSPISYPDFVFDKPKDVRHADVLMAFDIYKWLAGENNLPDDIRRFMNSVYKGNYRGRDTIIMYKRFQKVVDSVWERKFLPFKM